MTTANGKSLYERLGERKGIEKLVDGIVDRHMINPIIKPRFLPYKEDPENLKKIKEHLTEFICAGTGGPQDYTGKTMENTHRGMNISEAEYMAATDDIMETLEDHNIDEKSKNEMLAIAYSLKEQIMKL